jgi:hypothetical protein
MLTFQEMADLDLCPRQKYGWNKVLEKPYPKPEQISDQIYRSLPLQMQVYYSMESVNGMRQKINK